jgi:hypothetical protein
VEDLLERLGRSGPAGEERTRSMLDPAQRTPPPPVTSELRP